MLGSLPSFARLEAELGKLPGVGSKTAARLAFHLLRTSEAEVAALAEALLEMKRKVRYCEQCFHIAEERLCSVCASEQRDRRLLCVVEQSQDLLAIERSHSYKGLYHVLHGVLSPLDGVDPEDLKIPQLQQRLNEEGFDEVIIATNFSVEGEATALYLARLCQQQGVSASRLAHGIPSGSGLEYIDAGTVQQAVSGRRAL